MGDPAGETTQTDTSSNAQSRQVAGAAKRKARARSPSPKTAYPSAFSQRRTLSRMNQTFGPDQTDPSNAIFMPRKACSGATGPLAFPTVHKQVRGPAERERFNRRERRPPQFERARPGRGPGVRLSPDGLERGRALPHRMAVAGKLLWASVPT